MKKFFVLAVLFATACNNESRDAIKYGDTPVIYMEGNPTKESLTGADSPSSANNYSNDRFKDVTVTKQEGNIYQVNGKAQVFEAAFSWVLMDGNKEVKSGHEMTDAGAPEFGNFSFIVQVPENTGSYQLMLYEASAKDGSRQHQLSIPINN